MATGLVDRTSVPLYWASANVVVASSVRAHISEQAAGRERVQMMHVTVGHTNISWRTTLNWRTLTWSTDGMPLEAALQRNSSRDGCDDGVQAAGCPIGSDVHEHGHD
jgi:hypothetical protein